MKDGHSGRIAAALQALQRGALRPVPSTPPLVAGLDFCTYNHTSITMELDGFQWDEGNWPKCGSHGVSKSEIEAALTNGRVAPSMGRSVTEQRFIPIGRNEQGRPLFVAFVVRKAAGRVLVRPVSARYMHEKEARRYET